MFPAFTVQWLELPWRKVRESVELKLFLLSALAEKEMDLTPMVHAYCESWAKSAAGRFHCAVEIETPIAQDCTLARMAHAQGSGFVRRTERRVLKVEYVKAGGPWSIAKAELALV